jgi:hypothetical protein
MIENSTLEEGTVVEITDGVVKKNVFGGLEIRLPKYSQIKKLKDDKTIPEAPVSKSFSQERIDIKNINEGFYEIHGNFVQLFNTNPLFSLCPKCKGSLEEKDGDYFCGEHGKIEPENTMIISGIVDDGTGSIRTVFFREQAEKFSGIDVSGLEDLSKDEIMNSIKKNVLGKDIILSGRIRRNKLFDNLELVVNDAREPDITTESKRLIREIRSYGE